MTKSLRVYFVPHGERGRRRTTGILMRTWDAVFDAPPPAAFGASEDEVLADLERQLLARAATGEDRIDRYLWEESFSVREIRVDVHPLSSVAKRAVIGKKSIPLRIAYAHCPMPGGGHRVMLPRFGGWFIVEDHALAPEILRHAIATWMLGEKPKNAYDFRYEGPEYVRAWAPPLLDRLTAPSKEGEDAARFPTLAQVGEDLTARAARGKLPAIVGASAEVDRLLPRLRRPIPPSLVIVGPPSVGKTTFVRRLARAFVAERKSGERETARRLWSTSADRIIAGMVYLGMWQERCMKLVDELDGEGDYLFVGPLLPLLRPQPDGASIAEMLEPALAAERISLIAECTAAELERAQRAYPAFVARLRPVRLEEPSPTATIELVAAYAERRGAPRFHPAALKRLVQLLTVFSRTLAFPGKALRFVDWLVQARAERRRGEPARAEGEAAPQLGPRDIAALYSRSSGIPVDLLSDDTGASLDDLAARLSARVIGQDHACAACARVLARFKAGMSDPERPTGTLLFVGPTGVGKTELAKQLTRVMFGDERRMVRLDMSEYATWGSAARLPDVSPGQTSLARSVAEQPLSVVLLDEIEKAHPEVFDLLLGVLGEGRLTDASGRLVDFRNAIVVMTSNLGVREQSSVGFGAGAASDFERAVREHFRPELVGRIDRVVAFRALSEDDVMRIADLELAALADREGLARRRLRLAASDEARRVLARLGYHPTRGARPLKRVIEEKVIVPVAAALARDPGLGGGTVRVIGAGEDERAEEAALVIRVR